VAIFHQFHQNMNDTSLSIRTLKNVAYSFLNYSGPILFSIFITPIVVHRLGVVDYGVYILVNTVTAFLVLIDFGLATALIKYIAEYHAAGELQKLKNLLDSAYTLYFIIGSVGFGVFCAIGKFFLPIFKISPLSQGHIEIVFILAGVVFFINAINYIYIATLGALQRFDMTTKSNLLQLTFLNIGILALVLFGYRLKAIFLLSIVSSLLFVAFNRYYFKKALPGLSIGFAWNKEELKKSYKFGLLAALSNLASSSLMQLDRFFVPIFVGPVALTYYSLPGNVAQKTSGITGSLGSILFPLTSALSGKGETEKIGQVYKKVFRSISLVAAAISASIAFFSYPILQFWLGKQYAEEGWFILIILSATHYFLAIYSPLVNMLMGLGKIKFLTCVSLLLATTNIVLLFLLVPKYGIVGAAWAYLGGVLPIPIAFYWTERKFLGLANMAGFYLRLYLKLFITTAVLFVLVKFFILKAVHSIVTLLLLGPLSVILFFVLYKIFGFLETEDWLLAKNFMNVALTRFGIKKVSNE
jgi:O-antigen/teichoic acid export membrane protein